MTKRRGKREGKEEEDDEDEKKEEEEEQEAVLDNWMQKNPSVQIQLSQNKRNLEEERTKIYRKLKKETAGHIKVLSVCV